MEAHYTIHTHTYTNKLRIIFFLLVVVVVVVVSYNISSIKSICDSLHDDLNLLQIHIYIHIILLKQKAKISMCV
jgi:hypothetical protein